MLTLVNFTLGIFYYNKKIQNRFQRILYKWSQLYSLWSGYNWYSEDTFRKCQKKIWRGSVLMSYKCVLGVISFNGFVSFYNKVKNSNNKLSYIYPIRQI